MEKKWYTSKTLWFNLLVSGLGALEASFSVLQDVIPVNIYAVLVVVLAVGNATLRVISTAKLIK